MTYLIIIVALIAIAIFDDRVRGRKKVPPPTVPQDIPRPKQRSREATRFEIPPMRGIPGKAEASVDAEVLHAQELRAKWEEARREAQREKRAQERRERAAAEAAASAAAAAMPVPRTARPAALMPQLTPHTMQQAVVLAEVLGKPRAMRRFPRR